MIELINLAIDIIELLIKDYHIRLREERERQERQEILKEICRKITDLSYKINKDLNKCDCDWNEHIRNIKQNCKNKY
jgi:GTP1/Obg family GTP-binding protein